MDRRRSKRKKVELEVRVSSGGTTFTGTAENISEQGLYMETPSANILNDASHLATGTDCEVYFTVPSGEEMRLHCRIVWSYMIAPEGVRRKIGMEIIFPPPQYIDYYRSIE